MMDRSVLLIFLLFILFWDKQHTCTGTCYGFLAGGNIGSLTPKEIPSVAEGKTLKLNCTLLLEYTSKNSLNSSHIFWRYKDTKNPKSIIPHLTPQDNPRLATAVVDDMTASMMIGDVKFSDSGEYTCVVNDGTREGRTVCSVEVSVGGPPKKYVDFQCISQNFTSLECTFKRNDSYYGLSKTVYNVTYRSERDNTSVPCRNFEYFRNNGSYRCLLNSHSVPKFSKHYVHTFTINGSNPQGFATWEEPVNPLEHVRLSPPRIFEATGTQTECNIKWGYDDTLDGHFLQDVGIVNEIDYKKLDEIEWSHASDEEEKRSDLHGLDPFTTYEIRVRSRPRNNRYWSDYATITCITQPAKPDGKPGTVIGAYEEIVIGSQRQITLYWKGIPKNKRNGEDFRYRVSTRNGEDSESISLDDTRFANIHFVAPSNRSVVVDVLPMNSKGEGEKQSTTIPAIHDAPLTIDRIDVVKFSDHNIELSWKSNRAVEGYDLFYCETSLEPHLAKCTDSMDHVSVTGSEVAYNFTKLKRDAHYRFAVAAHFGKQYSGMKWASKTCTTSDARPRVEGLTVTPLANASVTVSWNLPCQHRFMDIPGYQVDFYPCEIKFQAACVQDQYVTVNETSVQIDGLDPERRYCFVVSILNSTTARTFYPFAASQCMETTALIPSLPLGKIIGGAVTGAIILAVIAIFILRGIKRVRKDFKEIQKESRNIIIPPPAKSDTFDDDYGQQQQLAPYYTKIDSGEKSKFYLRQVSDNSGSSGHGSYASDFTTKSDDNTDHAHLIVPHKHRDLAHQLPSLGERRSSDFWNRYSGSSVRQQPHRLSNVDLSSTRSGLVCVKDNLQDTVSLNRRTGGSLSPLSSSESMTEVKNQLAAIRRPSSLARNMSEADSGASSGVSGVSENSEASSFGYVVAPSLQTTVSNASNTNTGDTGYISQPSSTSYMDHRNQSGISAGSSGFSEMESSPVIPKKRALAVASRKFPINQQKSNYYLQSDEEMEEVEEEEDERGGTRKFIRDSDFDSGSGQSSPIVPTTRLLDSPPKQQVSGYVSWP